MPYDPFERGPHPVGVLTRKLSDPERDGRSFDVELWYPAAATTDPSARDHFEVVPGFPTGSQQAARDAVPARGSFPVIGFSHGFGTERRQSSFLCTHLASHGFVVFSPNHAGNTMADWMGVFMSAAVGGAKPNILDGIDAVTRNRPLDLLFALQSLATFGAASESADVSRVGLAGHSFGGWTALTCTARHSAVSAVLALAPAGGHSPLLGRQLGDKIDLAWEQPVAAELIVADRDSLLPLEGMHQLFSRIANPKRMFVLGNTDHMHFCDRPQAAHEMFRVVPQLAALFNVTNMPPFSELCPAAPTLASIRGLALAHFDAALKGQEEAAEFTSEHALSALSRRGMEATRV